MPKLVSKKPPKRVASAVCSTPWALEESVLSAIVELLELRSSGKEFTLDEVRVRIAAARRGDDEEIDEEDGPYVEDGIAVLPLSGVLAPRLNFFMQISGGTSTQEFSSWFQAALDNPDVKAILLAVDSPGGDARGNEELAQQIRAARGKKPIIASVTGLAASAAYYVASAADELIASPSSELGSIGTFMVHSESSRAAENAGVKYTVIRAGENKAAGNSVEPLTEKPRAVLQERIDDYNALFENAVAKNRGVSRETVQKNFGQGKSMIAQKAVAAGLADRIGTFSQVFDALRAKIAAAAPAAAPAPTSARSPLSASEILNMDTPSTAPATNDQMKAEREKLEADRKQLEQERERLQKEKAEIESRERARIQDLRARAELLGVSQAEVDAAVENALSVADALVKWTDTKSKSERPVGGGTGGGARVETAAADKLFAAGLEALSRQTDLRDTYKGKAVSSYARDLQYAGLSDIAAEFVRFSNPRFSGTKEDICAEALYGNGREIRVRRQDVAGASTAEDATILAGDLGYQRPSDFPNLLSALVGKMLDWNLTYSPATYQGWAYQIPAVPDFKPKTIIAVGEYAELPRVPDGADFTESSVSEEASWIQADAYGDEWTLTPKMVADDDLGALEEVVRDKTISHEMTINRLCINLITSNATAGDGFSLFDSASHHFNQRTPGAAPATAELAAMRLLFRQMKGVSGRRKLNLTLRTLLVPEGLETATQQLLATLTLGGNPSLPIPVTSATTEIFRGNVNYFVEPMLGEVSEVQYYGFAERNTARAIIYTFQRGYEGGLRTRNYYWPKNNARVFQFEGRFAAAIRNWRGIVQNVGQ